MKQLTSGRRLYSPSDLVAFLECPHTSYLSIKNLSEEIRRSEPSSVAQMISLKASKHKADYLQKLKDSNKVVVEIPSTGSLSERAQLSDAEMRAGTDIIYKGVLLNTSSYGVADFLVKCRRPSSLGDYSYEVLDIKLSKTARPEHILQLCVHSALVAGIQGIQPIYMYLVPSDGVKIPFRLNDFRFYYEHIRKRFENYMTRIGNIDSYPEPCRHCNFCEWQEHCKVRWQQDEHLSLIANIQRRQTEKLRAGGIHTIGELVAAGRDAKIPKLLKNTVYKLHTQASLQNYKAKTGKNKYKIMKPQSNKGFALMPPPDAADLFFDIESNPLYPDSLAYLFGIYRVANDKEVFKAFWGHDRTQETKSFKQLMDFLDIHLSKYPGAHIYHYGRYETNMLKRLAYRGAVRTVILKKLIQARRFIDLYDIVRDSIYISEPAYTLKNLENFYMVSRRDTITAALDSIIVYNEWCETRNPKLLQQIADYNEADCRSTYLLRNWLLSIKPKAIPWRCPTPRQAPHSGRDTEYENYKNRFRVQPKKPPAIHRQVAHLLEFHNRENKKPRPREFPIGTARATDSATVRSAIYRYANHLINTPEVAHVATELLMQNPPRIKNKKFGSDIVYANGTAEELLKIVAALDHSYLLIQTPPGSSKTQICGRVIVDLIKRGKKIGIGSNSHRAIHTLLREIERLAVQEDIHFSGIKKASRDNRQSFYSGDFIRNRTHVKKIHLAADLYAATAPTFASPHFDNRFDYLFIDEAAQVSVADVIAMSNATANIILAGDHIQIKQPTRHRQKAELSMLELLSGNHTTVPKQRGIFLNQSYRLKPAICRFISKVFYDGRLLSHESTGDKNLRLQGTELPNEGIVMVNTKHANQSTEEIKIIENLYRTLLGQTVSYEDRSTRRIDVNDILVVTPYDAQTNYLYPMLPDGVRIGTVDKFQGQEALVVLISMVGSDIGRPRRKIVESLYSGNHLNVALSRAQCLAIVVASHKLKEAACTTVEHIKLVNTYCRLEQYAAQRVVGE